MEINFTAFLIVCPLVFLAGLVDSIAGGGGLISLPAYLLAGLPAHNAIATNKLSSFMGISLASARFFKNRLIDIKLAIPSMILAVCGSGAGAQLILLISDSIIKYILLFVLPAVAAIMILKKDFEPASTDISRKKQAAIVFISSFLIGMYDGFYGPGTGTFLLIIYTQIAKMPVKTAAGNVKAVNFASNLGGLIVFVANGRTIYLLGLTAGIFSIIGNYIGSGLVLKNGAKIVRPIIIFVLALLFAKIIFGF